MRADDVSLHALLTNAAAPGVPHIGNVRAILTDTALVGLCRKAFVDAIGFAATRRLLVRLGFAQGWHLGADPIRLVEPLTPDRLPHLVGQLLTALGIARSLADPATVGPPHAVVLAQSCEAEEHLRHCGGPAREPVCWFAVGCVSGYLSRASARIVLCREVRCAGTGDTICQLAFELTDTTVNIADTDPFADAACAYLLRALGDDGVPVTSDLAMDGVAATTSGISIGTRSPRMRTLIALAERAAQVDSTVLITGESGVGKERLARYIHERSKRAKAPFMAINCGALPETLLENELFGHRRGAFTGALDDRAGLFEAADGGSIFLDEIGEMPIEMQVKLLRVLQEREVRRLGETRSSRIDVRILAATNRDLRTAITRNRFREDLYYRLAVVPFHVPPLRERPDDLHALATSLLIRTAHQMKRPIRGYTRRALDRLLAYDWPGNIRELENAIERACALSTSELIDLDDLPEQVRASHGLAVVTPDNVPRLWEIERDYILTVLRRNGGNRTQTAEQLGIGNKTLYRKLRQYQRLATAREEVSQNDHVRSK